MSNYCKNCYELTKQLDQLKVENGELKQRLNQCWKVEYSFVEQIDQLEGVIKKYEECNKYLVEENGKTYTRLEYKLLKTLTEIKEVLQFYNNSKIGVDKGNGIFEFEVSNDNVLGGKLICYYDTNPAKEALQRISEVLEQ